MLDLLLYQNTLEIAIVAFTVSIILTQEDYILYWWYLLLIRLNKKKMQWLSYPFGYCEKCLGGQIALWYFIFSQGITLQGIPTLIAFICITIFNIEIIKIVWKKIK